MQGKKKDYYFGNECQVISGSAKKERKARLLKWHAWCNDFYLDPRRQRCSKANSYVCACGLSHDYARNRKVAVIRTYYVM